MKGNVEIKGFVVSIILLFSLNSYSVDKMFFEHVIVANSRAAVNSANQIINDIKHNPSSVKNTFFHLISNWKRVEATYILGDLDENYLDIPRYIDIFHGNNEDIKTQLDLIIASNDKLEYALYKYSYKSINALEYLLFTQDLSNARIKMMALIIAKSIKHYLNNIEISYQALQTKFTQDEKFASAILLNTLVSSSYALKEWRIGDVAGLSKKYKGNIDANRGEYSLSKNSVAAILAILQTHKQAIDSPDYQDFGDVARKFGATKEIYKSIGYLDRAIMQAKTMKEQDLTKKKGKVLYQLVNQLMQSYHLSLMDKLGFISKVLDADGD